jgi:hypothetical protein
LRGVGKKPQNSLAFKIGNTQRNLWNPSDVVLVDRYDACSFDWDPSFDRASAEYVGVTGVECQVEATLSVRIDANVHHYVLFPERSLTFQMEDDGHVVLVVGGIESRHVDGALAQTVAIVGSVKRWLSIISHLHFAAIDDTNDPCMIVCDDGVDEKEQQQVDCQQRLSAPSHVHVA